MSELWRPECDLSVMRLRAHILSVIRQFFAERAVLEVETPLLCHTTGTDPHLDFFSTQYQSGSFKQTLFLQTSPEFAMKRLLASGSGCIFQICKAFRNGESGGFHNPEFTLLEWYRVGFDLGTLMDEVEELLSLLFKPFLALKASQRISYQTLFQQHTGLNPLVFSLDTYQAYAKLNQLSEAIELCENDHSLWLDFIFSHKIQPLLGEESVCLVYGYPACQASLARINSENPLVADRFEVFVKGVELGNGFFELADAQQQESRFELENEIRQQQGLLEVKKDVLFLAALKQGLPDCSGIAIGIDRLLMLLHDSSSINDVLIFPLKNA